MKTENNIRKFDKQAQKYERMRDKHLLKQYCRQIFKEADGEVLELSIGVGNNFEYYQHIEWLTGVDFSPEMLKFAEAEAKHYSFGTTLLEKDIEGMEFEENRFDTIVSSLSFCSYQNPVALMNKLSKWCRPDGQILLMEHGVSTSKPLAILQKIVNPLSFKIVGCHQKRDIEKLVQQSDLEIKTVKRFVLGCVYLIWARPKRV